MQKLAAILLVDDDPTSNYLNQLLLEELAVADQLLVATNGAEALHILTHVLPPAAAAGPVLVLLDVNMPVMNGFELLNAVKADNGLKHLPVLMVTAEARKEDIVRAAKDGAAGYIVKPFTKATLEEKVQKIMQKLAAMA